MTDQRFHSNPNEFQATRTTRRWWPKTLATFMTLGGIYGAAVGSAINTTAGAADIIGIAAAVMAVLCGVPGTRFGLFFGALNRIRFGRLFLGLFAAMGGATLGGFLGLLAVMPFGAMLGAVAGWFFTWAVLPRGFFRLLLGGVLGVVLGVYRGDDPLLEPIAFHCATGHCLGPGHRGCRWPNAAPIVRQNDGFLSSEEVYRRRDH